MLSHLIFGKWFFSIKLRRPLADPGSGLDIKWPPQARADIDFGMRVAPVVSRWRDRWVRAEWPFPRKRHFAWKLFGGRWASCLDAAERKEHWLLVPRIVLLVKARVVSIAALFLSVGRENDRRPRRSAPPAIVDLFLVYTSVRKKSCTSALWLETAFR